MSNDERNFRSTYYEKVGCRSVEEKKSLNILLKDKPLNRIKLKQFCLSFTVPTSQRSLLWNVILGILPVYPDSREYFLVQRKAVYDDTLRAVKSMKYIDEKTSKPKLFLFMWLLENKRISHANKESSFVKLAEALLQVFESDIEIYWITKGFYGFSLEIASEIDKMKELTEVLLEKEDNLIFTHLEKNNILKSLPLEKWYTTIFASIISEAALMRIWDKICGGSRKIVVFLFIVILKNHRIQILLCTELSQVNELIEKKKENQDDLIVNKAIELWQNNKSHTEFTVQRKDN